MLNQFFYDWNTAIQSRTIVNETRNQAGVITMQETKFKFRDVEITMFSRILPGGENLPPEKRRWASEMFVPSTNKIIPSVRYRSKAHCAAEILSALVPGRAHEDRVEARNQIKQKRYLEKLYNDRKARLTGTSFTEEDQEFILKWMQEHVIAGRVSWDDTLVDILCKYHNYITGVGLSEQGINLNEEAELHIGRMYNTACQLITETFRDRNGLPALNRGSVSRNFLSPRNNIKYGVYVVRSGYSKIFDECKLSTKFMHVVKLMAEYYARVTGVSVEDRIAEVKAFREKMRERRHERNFKGGFKRRPSGETVTTFSNRMAPIGSTIGDAFGDVLDKVKENITDEHTTESDKKKYKKTKKQKTVTPVTDGQINGKQMEQPKAEKVEEESIPETDEQLPPIPDEIEIDLPPEAPEEPASVNEDVPNDMQDDYEDDIPEKPRRKSRKKSEESEE